MLNSSTHINTTTTSSSSIPPPHRRRRVAFACRSCRDRKDRCDGARPVCSTCQRRDNNIHQCEYFVVTTDITKHRTERAYIRALHNHLADLQRAAGRISRPQNGMQHGITHRAVDPPGADASAFTSAIHHQNPPPNLENFSQSQSQPEWYLPQGALGLEAMPFHTSVAPTVSANTMGTPFTSVDATSISSQFYSQPPFVSLFQQYSQAPPRQTQPSQGGGLPTFPNSYPASSDTGGPYW